MKVLVSGSTGFIGSALVDFLKEQGHEIVLLVRTAPVSSEAAVFWDPALGVIDAAGLEGLEAAVHLSGESIAQGRWTRAKKARIRDSRVASTRLLCESLARLKPPPGVLVCASAIGYYGNRGEEFLDEGSPSGNDFLAEVCRAWEAATAPAAGAGARVVNVRFGAVLGMGAGVLAGMLPVFKLGLGGIIGNGRQFVSWVALDDAIGAIDHALATESLEGPVNVVAPHPVTNYTFTKTLGEVLGRPTLFHMPRFVVRMALGEMADALLLASQRVEPRKLANAGYSFKYA